ncbi:MAG TPA: phosphomannomutase/phosphoglucomutase, partial [Polyangiaceae bacterium]|nr:phosphomannomutase/phosphoglucomutase [Polyangiaceae bacterium]
SRVLARLGLQATELFCDMDGRFPNHHPDPTVPENLAHLLAAVKEKSALVGIAFDGDGDRVGVVDGSGEIIWGDRLLALCARPVLAQNPGAAVLGDVKCSQVLFDDVARHGGRPIMFKTGHSLIKTKMKEEHAVLAGEMSGHFFFADRFFGHDDAIYAALRVLEILTREGKGPSELLADLPRTVSTPELRFDCPDALKFAVVKGTLEKLRGQGELNEIDGVRVTWPDGAWGLVRASNTGPVIVMRFEAPTPERLAEVRGLVESIVRGERAGASA